MTKKQTHFTLDQDIYDHITEREWWWKFRDHLYEKDLSEATIRSYLSDVAIFAFWFGNVNGEHFEPSLITSIDLRAWRKYSIHMERIKPATWNRRRSSMISFTKWARERGDISYDPMENIKAVQEVQAPPRWISKNDQGRFLRTIERAINTSHTERAKYLAVRDGAMVALMLWAGLREAEVAALDSGDITIKPRSGSVVVRNGKGQKRREIPLNHEARIAVGRWLDIGGYGDSKIVPSFFNKYGPKVWRISTRTIQRRIKRFGIAAGIEITPHQLRHTFAKRLVDSGTPLTVIQKLMGHARLETTARYVEPGWEDFEQAVEGI